MKRFSIIICSYNGERTIKKAIESILSQYMYAELVESLILVDNASTDSTSFIMKEFEKSNQNIKYCLEPKPGLMNARMTGCHLVDSEWIIWVDDDNYLCENWIFSAEKYIESNPKIGAFGGVVIPTVKFKMNQKQESILKRYHIALACNCYDAEQSKDFVDKTDLDFAPGAGLATLSCPIKKLADSKNYIFQGRTGDSKKLVSGEDYDLILSIRKEGYKIGLCAGAKLMHDIPESRLTEEYMVSLHNSFADCSILVIKNKHEKDYKIRYLCLAFLSFLKVFKYVILKKTYSKIEIKTALYATKIYLHSFLF